MEDLKTHLETYWEKECSHLALVAYELKLKSDKGDLEQQVIYAELLRAFSMGRDSD